MDREYYEFWQRISEMRFNANTSLIDFLSGSNGHFLEYSINTQIFGAPVQVSPFTDIYTIQTWSMSDDYQQKRRCFAVHWSQHELPIQPLPEMKLIRITVSSTKSKLICFFNQILRGGDRPFWKFTAEQLQDHDDLRRRLFFTLQCISQTSWKEFAGDVLEIDLQQISDKKSTCDALETVARFLDRDVVQTSDYLDFCDTYFLHQQGPISYQKCIEFLDGKDHDLDLLEQVAVCYIKSTNQPGKKVGDMIDHLLSGKFDSNKFRDYW